MLAPNEQLKVFVEGVFSKHSSVNPDILSIGQLYQFFCNFFANSQLKVTLADVQQTLKLKITKRQMYQILKLLAGRRREALRERPNRSLNIQQLGANRANSNRQQTQPKKEASNSGIKVVNNSMGMDRRPNTNQNQNSFCSPQKRPPLPQGRPNTLNFR